ncbi:SDR family NAD(P)-dependent oxidoreductase [Arthrobacter ginkgonis]|uniref:SDR family NAD(P)-dependent oxidoreductase n=1 Tax=Arthrobacter ginkgonis TaxID=1630594 RepID=UPI0031E8CF17
MNPVGQEAHQQLLDRNVLITGAASGLGLAMVQQAFAAGARVTALDINARALDEALAPFAGDRLIRRVVDVTDEADVSVAVQESMEAFGSLDACLNNAGIGAPLVGITELAVHDFARIMQVNAQGSFIILKHVMSHMRQAGHGAVVNTGSILGSRGVPNYAAYCASKAAIHALTKVAALEGAHYGVRVNAIAPGLIDTPMNDAFHAAVSPSDPARAQAALEGKIPLSRYAGPTEVANAALFLLSDAAAYITGEILDVDGGLSTSF